MRVSVGVAVCDLLKLSVYYMADVDMP